MNVREQTIGIVTRNDDPEILGRVKVRLDTILDGKVHPDWASPLFPYAGPNFGWFFVPEVGSTLEIEIAPDEKSIDHPELFYRAVLYSDKDQIPDEFKVNYPNRKGIKTPSGHIFFFDDTKGEELVRLFHLLGTGFEIDKDGSWIEKIVKDKTIEILGNLVTTVTKSLKLEAGSGHKLEMDDDADTVELAHSIGTSLKMLDDGSLIENVIKDKLVTILGNWTIAVSQILALTATTEIKLLSPLVSLGTLPTDPLVLGTFLTTYLTALTTNLATHTHTAIGLGAPTSPPLVPPPVVTPAILSAVSKTQ